MINSNYKQNSRSIDKFLSHFDRNYSHALKNMKVTVIPVIIGVLGTVPKGLLQGLEDLEIRGRVETIKTIPLLRSARNTEKSPEDLRRLAVTQTPVKKLSATTDEKNAQGVKQ